MKSKDNGDIGSCSATQWPHTQLGVSISRLKTRGGKNTVAQTLGMSKKGKMLHFEKNEKREQLPRLVCYVFSHLHLDNITLIDWHFHRALYHHRSKQRSVGEELQRRDVRHWTVKWKFLFLFSSLLYTKRCAWKSTVKVSTVARDRGCSWTGTKREKESCNAEWMQQSTCELDAAAHHQTLCQKRVNWTEVIERRQEALCTSASLRMSVFVFFFISTRPSQQPKEVLPRSTSVGVYQIITSSPLQLTNWQAASIADHSSRASAKSRWLENYTLCA